MWVLPKASSFIFTYLQEKSLYKELNIVEY